MINRHAEVKGRAMRNSANFLFWTLLLALVLALSASGRLVPPTLDQGTQAGLAGQITEYVIPTPESLPHDPAVNPQGRVWYTGQRANTLGMFDAEQEKFTEFSIPTPNSGPRRLAVDSQYVRFTENRVGKLGRYDYRSGEWKEWDSPSGPGSRPYGIALSADGAIWYNEAGANKMVRFDPQTEEFKTLPLPSPRSVVRHMVRDSKGTLWLAVSGPRGIDNNQIARID
jgi:virginiamycin B lyase